LDCGGRADAATPLSPATIASAPTARLAATRNLPRNGFDRKGCPQIANPISQIRWFHNFSKLIGIDWKSLEIIGNHREPWPLPLVASLLVAVC